MPQQRWALEAFECVCCLAPHAERKEKKSARSIAGRLWLMQWWTQRATRRD
jgi:hypothetical protein